MNHSYEEIRSAALDILSERERVDVDVNQYGNLQTGIALLFARRAGVSIDDVRRNWPPRLTEADAEKFLEVFWGLFREGTITLGLNDSNREFPFFRVSSFGRHLLSDGTAYFFHDVDSYKKVVSEAVPSINAVTLVYLQEAMQAFRSGCLLSASVMLGVAAEHTFLLLLEEASTNARWKTLLAKVSEQRTILQKINKFKNVLDQHLDDLPAPVKEDLDTHFAGILAVVRNFRNESGHPTGRIISREQLYVLLHLFITYCKKMYQLRAALSTSGRAKAAPLP